MLPNILVSEATGFSDSAAEHLRICSRLFLRDLDRTSLIIAVRDVDVLWVRLRHKIDREVIEAGPNLRAIATPTTGLNHIDLAHAEKLGIHVISLQGATDFLQNVYATAEHAVALILSLMRHLPAAHEHAISDHWNRDLFIGNELHGKAAGVIGYGRLGKMVAKYLQSFGMRISVTDVKNPDQLEHPDIANVSLDHLLHTSDVVTLHVPLSDQTKGFFGKREFACMKPGSWFINTARGELVDERALLDALRTRHLSGAALDVLCDEQSSNFGDNSLVRYAQQHTNLLITPHIGGCTRESREKTERFLATRVVEFLSRGLKDSVATGSRLEEVTGTPNYDPSFPTTEGVSVAAGVSWKKQ
ncbi:MAG: putative D-isomer specific 2-hydroxyacid dehydrogenase NAD-binding [Candidatus Acidoferrum typicum]|nr:putative D-isomer specific 2-hydroxyacid dehydrogenase NAD-binding [Candidatus Acidoferrum typicum]